jgi:hypothetical protein
MTEHEREMLSTLMGRLGMISGALSLSAVRAGLVDQLSAPESEFSREAVQRLHRTLGEVLAAVDQKRGPDPATSTP